MDRGIAVFLVSALAMSGIAVASYPNSIESKADILDLAGHTFTRCYASTVECNPNNPEAPYVQVLITPNEFIWTLKYACRHAFDNPNVISADFVESLNWNGKTRVACNIKEQIGNTRYIYQAWRVDNINKTLSTVSGIYVYYSITAVAHGLEFPLPSLISG